MCAQQTTACFRASLHCGTFVILVLHIGQDTNKVQKAPLNGYWKLQSRPTPEDSPRGNLHVKSGIQPSDAKRLRWLSLTRHTGWLVLKVSALSFEDLTSGIFCLSLPRPPRLRLRMKTT